MVILAALVIALSVTAGVRSSNPETCHQPILCPCGNTGKQVKVCAEGENPCIRWSKCKTCQDYLNGCVECPEGLEGLSCLKAAEKLSRQRRQYATGPYRGNRRPVNNTPFQNQRQGGCPELNSPKLGSIRCVYNDRERTCVGKCLPGYSFEGRGSEEEITLTCTSDYYTPMAEFPPCKTEGKCDLVVTGAGSFNCTTGMSGTRCDVRCNGRYAGQYFCYPDQPWEPTLPDCVRPKDAQNVRQRCQCQNGGRCDGSGKCVCPSGWTGRVCERSAPRKSTCPDPGLIENGLRKNPDETDSMVRQSFEEGSSVVYSCPSEEYALQGSSLLTCRNDGRWSSPVPKCIRIIQNPPRETPGNPTRGTSFCRDPGVDSNGSRNPPSSPARGFPTGSNLEYFCNDGYDLEGEPSITCLSNGRWSDGRPTCTYQARVTASPQRGATTCQDPGVDSNGSRNPPLNPRGFVQGANLEFFCNDGYDMDGERSIFCLPTGRWSHARPTCRYQGRGATASYCGDPGTDPNGVRDIASPPSQLGFPENSRLEYSCNQGYDLQGDKMVICLASGKWSSQRPTCKAQPQTDTNIVYCPNPGSVDNGRLVYYAPLNKRQGGRPQAGLDVPEVPERGSLVYSCDTGYTMMGGDSITCENSGRWSANPPICVPDGIYCPEPGPISNGRVVYFPQVDAPRGDPDEEEYAEGGRLQYTCNLGYRLEGSDTLTCQQTGRWSDQPPVCNRGNK